MRKKLVALVMIAVVCFCTGCAGSGTVTAEKETTSVQEETGDVTESESLAGEESASETEVETETDKVQEILNMAHAAYLEQKHVIAKYEYANLSLDENGQPANSYHHERWAWDTEKQMLCWTVKWPNSEEFVAEYFDFANGKFYYSYYDNRAFVVREIDENYGSSYKSVIVEPVYQYQCTFICQLLDEVVEGYEDCYVISGGGYGDAFVVTENLYINKETYLLEKRENISRGSYVSEGIERDMNVSETWEYSYPDETSEDWTWFTEILELPPQEIIIPEEEID